MIMKTINKAKEKLYLSMRDNSLKFYKWIDDKHWEAKMKNAGL